MWFTRLTSGVNWALSQHTFLCAFISVASAHSEQHSVDWVRIWIHRQHFAMILPQERTFSQRGVASNHRTRHGARWWSGVGREVVYGCHTSRDGWQPMLLVAVLCPFVPMAYCSDRYYLLRLTLSDSIATTRLSIVFQIHPFVIGYMLLPSASLYFKE
jgi:hypothetical protein